MEAGHKVPQGEHKEWEQPSAPKSSSPGALSWVTEPSASCVGGDIWAVGWPCSSPEGPVQEAGLGSWRKKLSAECPPRQVPRALHKGPAHGWLVSH